jgi:hypothetical protein
MRRAREIAIVLLAVAGCIGWWKYLDVRIHAALAEEQTRFFDEALQQAAQHKTTEQIAADIEAVRIYYPSGTKQRTGSHLDQMVERVRAHAIKQLEERASKLRAEPKQ